MKISGKWFLFLAGAVFVGLVIAGITTAYLDRRMARVANGKKTPATAEQEVG